jgi:hypothetical protein
MNKNLDNDSEFLGQRSLVLRSTLVHAAGLKRAVVLGVGCQPATLNLLSDFPNFKWLFG